MNKPVEYHIHLEVACSDETYTAYRNLLDDGVRQHGFGKSLCLDEENVYDTGFDVYRGTNLTDVRKFVKKLREIGFLKDAISVYDLVPRNL